MLLQGLRSHEVLDLNRDDLLLPEAQIRVRGKGNKTRFLPLAPEANQLLDHYLRLERPQTATDALFVSLKGPARGARMTPAGLRSLFRYHRRTTGVKMANPHRFRHTFASDMVRAGVSLPALMQLMGHAHIQTTMVYVQITPLEVYQQYARAVAQHIRPVPGTRHEALPLRSAGPSIDSPVPTSHRVLHCRHQPRLSPSIPRHGAPLLDLSRRRPSRRLFARSVAP